MKDSEKNLAESIRHRLRNRFKESGEDISFGLQRFFADDARAAQWRAYLSRNSLPGAPADFIAVGELLQAFLVPLWRALADSRKFSDFWPPLGPWTVSKASEEPNI
jgi:hypothetical protein